MLRKRFRGVPRKYPRFVCRGHDCLTRWHGPPLNYGGRRYRYRKTAVTVGPRSHYIPQQFNDAYWSRSDRSWKWKPLSGANWDAWTIPAHSHNTHSLCYLSTSPSTKRTTTSATMYCTRKCKRGRLRMRTGHLGARKIQLPVWKSIDNFTKLVRIFK